MNGRNILILMKGLPRSGKTTWARRQNYPIVNPDSIRLALHGKRYEVLAEDLVWSIAKIMVRSLFLSGHHTVIVDATNNSKKRRDFWKGDDWDILIKIIRTSKIECINRAKRENDLKIIPVIERMGIEQDTLSEEEKEYIG